MLDLDAYLARIGYSGPRDPSLTVLRELHALHPAAIPFEGLDPLLGRPVALDLPALQAKLVGGRRGGYCFEQNSLFRAVLEAFGFSVTSLAARVLWMSGEGDLPTPRTHMLLRVAIAGESWIADVGFGGHLLTAPLRLVDGVEQVMPHGVMRFLGAGDSFTLQARVGDGWRSAYRFTLEPHYPADFEVANWFTSAHPGSVFRNNLLLERVTPAARTSLFNRRLTRRHADGRVEEAMLEDAGALGRALAEDLGVAPPVDTATLFARLPAG